MPGNSPVRIPAEFNRLAWSNLAAQSAEQIALAAAPIVAVLSLGAGAGATGVLQTAQTLPFLLFAIPAGVLADRMSRRTLMAAAEAVRTASLLVILLLTATHALSLPLLAGLGLVGACGTVVFSVAGPALVPALVPREALITANGRIELARTIAFAAGPALGGALVGVTTGSAAFGLAMMLSCVAVAFLIAVPEPDRAMPVRRSSLTGTARRGGVRLFPPAAAPDLRHTVRVQCSVLHAAGRLRPLCDPPAWDLTQPVLD